MPPGLTLMVMAVITGVIAGFIAWFLKFSIGHLASFFLAFINVAGHNWYIVALSVAGILLAGIYQRYIVHTNLEHGTRQISEALAHHRYIIDARTAYRPLIASIITLGLGGSAGAEDPAATTSAAVGNNIGRLFGVSPEMLVTMIGCGAGAGIAGIFKAPVGGVLFTLEVLKVPVRTLSVMALFVSSVCGSMTCYALTGYSYDVIFLPTSLFIPDKIWWVGALGIFCGFYSIYYSKAGDMLTRFFGRIRNPWLLNITGGIIVGVCLLCFPAMYSEGYDIVTDLVNGRLDSFADGSIFGDVGRGTLTLALLGLAVMVLKVFATIASTSAGGSAGEFAPTIFAGAFAGMSFALLANYFFDAGLPVGLYALYGTAGAFAGIIHAPLMAIFLVAEMVGNGYGYFLPLIITASASYLVVKLFTPSSRYELFRHDDVQAIIKKK